MAFAHQLRRVALGRPPRHEPKLQGGGRRGDEPRSRRPPHGGVQPHRPGEAHPKLVREEFLDMPATDMEIFQAFLVVRSQSGLFVAAPQTEARPPGEAAAESSPTGTQ